MCVIYIFTLFSALYFQAVLTTADNRTRATCKHCSLYFDVPPKPIFYSAVYVNMGWQWVGRFRRFDASQRLKPKDKLCWSRMRNVWFIQNRRVGLTVHNARMEASGRICSFLWGWGTKNRGTADFSHCATMRSGYIFSDSASYLFIISSSRSLRGCNVSKFHAQQQFCLCFKCVFWSKGFYTW